jgi:hypothetical protein
MRTPLFALLSASLAAWGCAPIARADEPKPLDKPADLETDAALAEAKRVEAELQASLDKVRAQRLAVEGRIRDGTLNTRAPERTTGEARIVNGVTTWAFPAAGALIKGASAASAESWCTGTLVGCQTFLTANHCVADDRDPAHYHVYLQSGGVFDVEAISPQRPDFNFPHGDLAVLRLKQAVEGITPIAVNTAVIANGTSGTIVGFGRSGGVNSDYGLKRTGRVVTAACDRPETSLLCWDYNAPAGVPGENSNTCNADSGGPLFITAADGTLTLAGVTSGGSKSTCLTGDHSYDVDVRQFEAWVREQAGTDLGTAACGASAPVGTTGTSVLGGGGRLTAGQAANFRLNVPAGVTSLRVALNAQDEPSTNVDLFVKRGSVAGPGSADCSANGSGNYAFCQFASPQAGPWFLQLKQGAAGDGDFQVVVTMLGPRP